MRAYYQFTCQNCGTSVKDDVNLNHCPECLWSQHIIFGTDSYPPCGAMMRPVKILDVKPFPVIVHRCIGCGFEITGNPVKAVRLGMTVTISWEPQYEKLRVL